MAEITITKENFEAEVMKTDKPVLIDFWATWCAPCKMLSPIIAEIAKEYDGRVKVGKINVEEQGELAMAFQVSSIPTVIVMKEGKVTNMSVGYRPKEQIAALLRENI